MAERKKAFLKQVGDLGSLRVAFVVAEFNRDFTARLEDVNKLYLQEQGVGLVDSFLVPGALEIPAMVKRLLDLETYDLIYVFGVVIRGATTHYDIVSQESCRGLTDLSIDYSTPLINGLLTCENKHQVEERISDNFAVYGLNLWFECQKLTA